MHYTNRKSKSRVSLLWSSLLALVLIGIAIIESRGISIELSSHTPTNFMSSADALGKKHYSVNDSVTTLIEWSDQLLDSKQADVMWTMRWDMNLESYSLEQLAQLLYIDEYNNALNKVISHNGTHITGAIPQHNGKLILQRVENEAGDFKVVALLQLKHIGSEEKKLKKFITYTDDMISQHADDITFSVKITGPMQDDALKRIKTVTGSTLVEEYKDEAMKVVTAYSPKLEKSYWLKANKMINLQYAVYIDKDSENSILTLAVPLISGEFGEVISK